MPSTLRRSVALAVLYAILVLPNHPGAATPGALAVFPLELPVLVGLLIAAGATGIVATVVRLAATGFLLAGLVIKVADLGMYTGFARPFNFVFDLALLGAGWNVLSGSSGVALAAVIVGLAVTALAGVAVVVWCATGIIARIPAPPIARLAGLGVALAVAAVVFFVKPMGRPAEAFTWRLAGEHEAAAARARADIARLEREAAADPALEAIRGNVLSRLAGRDVILAFVESYGRANVEREPYRETTRAALADVEAELTARGYAMRSAWLTSPVVGGQSWLAHATMLSGLWIDNQGRYEALLRSRRRALPGVALDAGRRSVAVMPAITMPWPESGWFGYSRVLAAKDLDYRGKPFNWVTMPDQYTWSAFERMELARTDRPPLFAEIALISSHAPWTPIPEPVSWDDVGEGTIFDAQAAAGPTPEEVWSDRERVRDHFRRSIDYALRMTGAFAARQSARPLFVVLGDHQPATFISGDETGRDVPIHVFGDPETMQHLEAWGWTPGMLPAGDAPVWPMDAFRARFLEAFSDPSAPG